MSSVISKRSKGKWAALGLIIPLAAIISFTALDRYKDHRDSLPHSSQAAQVSAYSGETVMEDKDFNPSTPEPGLKPYLDGRAWIDDEGWIFPNGMDGDYGPSKEDAILRYVEGINKETTEKFGGPWINRYRLKETRDTGSVLIESWRGPNDYYDTCIVKFKDGDRGFHVSGTL